MKQKVREFWNYFENTFPQAMYLNSSVNWCVILWYFFDLQIAIIATLLAAVHAEAEAEADPAVLYANAYHPYGHYGYGYGLGHAYGLGHYGYGAGYYGYGLGAYGAYGAYAKGLKSAPCVNAANVPVPCAGRKRRDAEADADAEAAAYYYGGYYGLRYPAYGYGYGLGPYYGRYYGYGLTGVAAHPGAATSHTFRSPQGLGK